MYRKAAIAFFIPLIILTETAGYIKSDSYLQLIKEEPVNEDRIVQKYGTLANSLADIFINKNDVKLISSFEYGSSVLGEKELLEKPNFVLIQVESMDSNIISKKHKDKYIMPFMNSLSKQSVFYPYVLSYHKAGGTSDCEFSVINSIEPLDSFPSIKIANYNYPNSIVRTLAKNSYKPAAFHGNVGTYFNRDKAFSKMGFMEFADMKKMGLDHIGWGSPDHKVFRYAADKLETREAPFFHYIITMTSHGPYTNARHYYNNSDYDDLQDELVKDYFNSMAYVDSAIEEYVSAVKTYCENTYIFIWGDHTPNINNNLFKQSSFMLDNKYFEFVPLMIITPDSRAYKEEKMAASFLDFAPTILHASGVSFNLKTYGENLLDMPETCGKIPFKGISYDRVYLYKMASGMVKTQ